MVDIICLHHSNIGLGHHLIQQYAANLSDKINMKKALIRYFLKAKLPQVCLRLRLFNDWQKNMFIQSKMFDFYYIIGDSTLCIKSEPLTYNLSKQAFSWINTNSRWTAVAK
jgi:hypothetical protein